MEIEIPTEIDYAVIGAGIGCFKRTKSRKDYLGRIKFAIIHRKY